MNIIWDAENAEEHFTKHHVSFNQAKRVFSSPDRRTFMDPKPNKYGEKRFVIIGTVGKHVLFVVYTINDDVITIISARRLTKRQRLHHLEDNR